MLAFGGVQGTYGSTHSTGYAFSLGCGFRFVVALSIGVFYFPAWLHIKCRTQTALVSVASCIRVCVTLPLVRYMQAERETTLIPPCDSN